MWRRTLIAAVTAGLLVAGFLLLLVRSEAGGARICAVAEAAIRDLARSPVSIGRCEVDPFTTQVRISDVRVGPAAAPLILAKAVSARLRTSALLSGRLQLDELKISEPLIDIDVAPTPTREIRPAVAPPAGSCLPSLGPLEVGTITVVGGRLELGLPGGTSIAADGLEMVVRGHGSRIELGLTAGTTGIGQGSFEAVLDRAKLTTEIDLSTGALKISRLDISSPAGTVFGQADFLDVCAPRGSASVHATVDLASVAPLLPPALLPASGVAKARLALQLKDDWSLDADVDGQGVRLGSMLPGEFSLSAHVVPRRATIRRLEVPLESGVLVARGAVALEPPYLASAKVRLGEQKGGGGRGVVVLGEVLRKLGVNEMPVHVEARGEAQFAGPLAGPNGMELVGSINVEVPEFGVYDRTWQERGKAQDRWVGIKRGALGARVVLHPDRLELLHTQVAVGRTSIDAVGVVHFDEGKGMALEIDAPLLQLGDLGPFGPAAITGDGSLTGTVRGPYSELDIEASASMFNADVMGLDLGALSMSARLRLDEMTLTVPSLRGQKGRSAFRGSFFMDMARDGAPVEARLSLPLVRLVDLATIARGIVPSLGELEGKLDATASGEVVARGPAGELDADAHLELTDVSAFGQTFPLGKVHARLVKGARVEVPLLALRKREASVEATGSLDFMTSDAYELQLRTRGFETQHVDALSAALPDLRGRLDVSVDASGRMANPSAQVKVLAYDWWLGEQPLTTASLGVNVAGGKAVVDGTFASPWKVGAAPRAAPGTLPPAPPGSMFHTLRGTIDLDGGLPFRMRAELDVPQVSALLPVDTLGDLEAAVRGTLGIRGALTDISSARARLRLTEIAIQKGATRVRNVGDALVTTRDGTVTLEALPLRGVGFDLDAYGTRTREGKLDFEVEGDADLNLLKTFVPALDDARGKLAVSLGLTGTDDAPVVLGSAELTNATVVPAGGVVAIRDGTGQLVFSPDTISVSQLSAMVNGAPVEVSGQLTLDRFQPRSLDLALAMQDVPLQIEPDMPLRLSGTPTLRGSLDDLTLGGAVEVSYFRFRRELELERTIIQLLETLRSRRPPTPKVLDRAEQFLTFDLGVELGDVALDNNLIQTILSGSLRVVGTNRRPGLLGAVSLVDGRAFVRNNEYEVTSGVVNFTDPDRIAPTFDVRADTQVREFLVHVTATGTPEEPRLLLSSEPPLSEADIVTLLTLGVTSRDFDRTGGGTFGGLLLDAAYNASGLSDEIKRLLPKTALLKDATFRVTSAYSEISGNIEPVAQFETKLFRENIKARAQTSYAGARLLDTAAESGWAGTSFQGIGILSLALFSFVAAELSGGNGFISAFVAGMVFGNTLRHPCVFLFEFMETQGQLLMLITFTVFGAALLPEVIGHITPTILLYAVLSLTFIRIIPVGVSLLGAGLRFPTPLFLGWFGPRGLASILFVLLILEEAALPHSDELFATTVVTVALSTLLHGVSAAPLAKLYGRLTESMGECEENQSVAELPLREGMRNTSEPLEATK